MSPTLVFALLSVSALITSFISGILGMAGGMILMGVLLAVVSVPTAMLLHGTTQLASNGWRAFLWRGYIDRRIFAGYALGSLLILGVYTLIQFIVSKPVAYLILGLTPFLATALPESWHLNVERKGHPFVCGAICTALQLASGVSGPILDSFFVRAKMNRQQVVATKASTQSLGHLLKIIYFGGIVPATADIDPWLMGAMIALAFVGTTLSRGVLEKMSDTDFRKWTRWTVWSIGVFYLASAAWLFWRG
jgi:uncharacterized protein